ncbi:MAG: LD-carboxypeptidase [Sphingomonas bacterium]|uniref:LD-carboxypeptidase n=1 Tax=Sphingomonas bacterium TaxID=1895847 RepID=UPI002609B243|nr:LD-carboxypeptidase [Sphingomonas bacterium]MDB5707403.1 LD-carboxypeptidase [Sphingomonas bacterium]
MRIGIVAPGRPIDRVIADRAAAAAAIWFPGVELVFHPQCFLSDGGHFAGVDAARAAAFLDFANDPAFDALWFARGGYGANRILHAVMPKLGPAAAAKSYCGYSDTGFVLGALYATKIGHPVHAPLVSDISRSDGGASFARTLSWLTEKNRGVLEPSLGKQPAVAFNLSILNALIGTPWLPDLAGHVLMIEDISEPLYRIDRMLFQMAHATGLKHIAGVRLGRVSDVIPNDPPFAEDVPTMIERWCREMGVPFLGPADIGHDAENKVVPFGSF